MIDNQLQRVAPKAIAAAIEALAARFGNRLITSASVREQHAHSTTWLPAQPPDAVVLARETKDIQDVVRICAPLRVPVIAFGTGTSLEGHINAPAGGVCIDLREINRILDVHVEDLDCVIEPGVTRKALNEHLRDRGVFFPIDPGADASIGGMASTRASGTNAVRYGTMRDNVLALKVVRGDGEIITTGTRAKKSAAGYDLTHLFVGAEGTLGIISELTIKLRGIPETIAAAACSFETVEGACNAVILAMQTAIPVARIELLNATQVRCCNAYSKLSLPETPLLLLEFHGSAAEVAEQSKNFAAIAQECGGGEFSLVHLDNLKGQQARCRGCGIEPVLLLTHAQSAAALHRHVGILRGARHVTYVGDRHRQGLGGVDHPRRVHHRELGAGLFEAGQRDLHGGQLLERQVLQVSGGVDHAHAGVTAVDAHQHLIFRRLVQDRVEHQRGIGVDVIDLVVRGLRLRVDLAHAAGPGHLDAIHATHLGRLGLDVAGIHRAEALVRHHEGPVGRRAEEEDVRVNTALIAVHQQRLELSGFGRSRSGGRGSGGGARRGCTAGHQRN